MRRVLPPANATFSAANRTITFATTIPASLSHVLRVVNLTRGAIYFDPTAESGAGYLASATYASPVLTLGVSTEGHANGDRLFIEYDDGQGLANVEITGPISVSSEVEVKNDSGSPIPVSPNIQQGSGAVTATTTRVTLATDGPGVAALTSLDNKTPALQSGLQPVLASGTCYRSTATITRPANQTPYAAGDVIGDTGGSAIITLANIGPSGGFIQIQSVRLLIYSGTLPTSMTGLRLHFYSASPTAIADNAAWDLVSGDRASYVDSIDLPTPTDLGSTLFTKIDFPGSLIKLASGSTSLFALLQTTTAATFAENSTVVDLRVNAYSAGV